MQLVDEQDDFTRFGLDFLEDRFQPFLEFAAELRAGNQRTEIERHQPLAAQAFRHIAIDDTLGKTFDDGGLANTRLADQNGVVLGPPRQDLHRPPDFLVTADHGIDLAGTRAFGQIGRVFIQRIVGIFGRRAVRLAPLAHIFDRLVQRLCGHARLRQRVGRRRAGR